MTCQGAGVSAYAVFLIPIRKSILFRKSTAEALGNDQRKIIDHELL